jgi:hypothetical protein
MNMLEQTQNSMCGFSLVRAAEAMLRTLGGAEVRLLFPKATAPDDPGAQLGLVAPEVEEVTLGPAAVRNVPKGAGDGHTRLEFLLPASEVIRRIEERQAASAKVFFEAALGILHQGRLLRIESTEADFFAGMAYLYRVVAVE